MTDGWETLQSSPGRIESSPSGRKTVWTLAISVLLILPCVWQKRIQAGDLASHTYNAWLTQLVSEGRAPGLFLVTQWNNVVIDLMLAKLGPVVGYGGAERITVATCVLVFFWGAFHLIGVASGRDPWRLVPALAMVAYGWTLQMGFLNYYLSLGLAFFALACLWQGGRGRWLTGLLLAVVSLLAHPIGFLWLIGTAAYVLVAGRIHTKHRWILFLAAIVGLCALHLFVSHYFKPHGAVGLQFYRYLGPDQLIIYGKRYRVIALAFLLLSGAIALEAWFRSKTKLDLLRRGQASLELWALSVLGIAMFWEGISISKYGIGLTFLPERLTSIVVVMLICVLSVAAPRTWHLVAMLLCASVFFRWMWQDMRTLNQMEDQVVSLVSSLPADTRVIQTIWPLPGHRVDADHIVDRACIGRCFSYADYEPSSLQFRIRVQPGSPIAVSSAVDGLAMREGRYLVRPTDPPLVEIYQCDKQDPTKLCLRKLVPGEVNGSIGYRPKY